MNAPKQYAQVMDKAGDTQLAKNSLVFLDNRVLQQSHSLKFFKRD
jgi:hypothetical protein